MRLLRYAAPDRDTLATLTPPRGAVHAWCTRECCTPAPATVCGTGAGRARARCPATLPEPQRLGSFASFSALWDTFFEAPCGIQLPQLPEKEPPSVLLAADRVFRCQTAPGRIGASPNSYAINASPSATQR
jgi:hypothetical protein